MAADDLLLRQAPHSPQAEQAVLGSMLIDPDCIKDVMDKLQPEDFYLRANRDIFETIYHMFIYSRPIDGVTVAGEMERNGVYNDNTRDYLVQLMDVTPTSANVMEYVKIVLDKSLMRQVAAAAGSITAMVQEGNGDAGDMLESAEQKVYAIRRGRSAQNMVTVSMVLQDVMNHLAELTASGGKTLPGLSTGLSAVDAKINGLNKTDLLLIAARPGMGKTSMALNIALNVAKKYPGKAVVFFNLEMSREQMAMRLLANESFVDLQKLVTGQLTEEDWGKLSIASSALSQTDIRVDDNPTITVAEMNAKCRRIENLGLVFIDYLQLMTSAAPGKTSENRVTVVSEISRALKIMVKELNVPVVCMSQLSRANESRTDKRPMLSDLRESGAIEQDADIVAFIHRPEYYGINQDENGMPTAGMAEIIIAKHRNGAVCDVNLRFLKEQARFADMDDSMLPPAQAAESQQAYDDYASGSNSQPGTSGLGAAMGGEFDVNRSTKIDDEAPF